MAVFRKGQVIGSLTGRYRVVIEVDEANQMYELMQLTESYFVYLDGTQEKQEIGTQFQQPASVVDVHFALFEFPRK